MQVLGQDLTETQLRLKQLFKGAEGRHDAGVAKLP